MKPIYCYVCLCVSFVLMDKCSVLCLEPVTTGFAVLTAISGSLFLATYDKITCRFVECCDSPWLTANYTGLSHALKNNLHGQHLVSKSTLTAVKSHLKNSSPEKALALSFHGWTGSGKNFVSNIIAEQLYKEGMKSKFVHLFVSTLHFPHPSKLETYKDQIRDWVKGNVSACARSMFIFDEVEKMPPGLIETLKPYIDFYSEINGVDYRRAIFIFLSNTGSKEINAVALDYYTSGKSREDITMQEVQRVIMRSAFNEEGGMRHSPLIDAHLIHSYVPFLPMERRHVIQCARDEFRRRRHVPTPAQLEQVADGLEYGPGGHQLYSVSGCKKVRERVDYVLDEE